MKKEIEKPVANEEAELIRAALKVVSSDVRSTDDPSLVELRGQVEAASPGLIERVKREGLPSLEECVYIARNGFMLGKGLYDLATKMGWIGAKK